MVGRSSGKKSLLCTALNLDHFCDQIVDSAFGNLFSLPFAFCEDSKDQGTKHELTEFT